MAHPVVSAGPAGAAADIAAAAAWSGRPEVALPIAVFAAAYAVGWWRLGRRGASVSAWRIAAAGGGIACLAGALLSPLDRVADTTFAGHMVQHLLLTAAAAPLLLLADPFPAVVWALPASLRVRAGRLFRSGARTRRLLAALTVMPVAWLAHALVMWAWHVPIAYDVAVGDRLVHDLEHLAFFATALAFWWPVIRPAPRLRAAPPCGLRIVYLLLAATQSALLGLLLALSPRAWYASYVSTAMRWGLSPGEDQALGGLLMWGVGGAIDMLAVLAVVARYLAAEDSAASAAGTAAPTSSSRSTARAASSG